MHEDDDAGQWRGVVHDHGGAARQRDGLGARASPASGGGDDGFGEMGGRCNVFAHGKMARNKASREKFFNRVLQMPGQIVHFAAISASQHQ